MLRSLFLFVPFLICMTTTTYAQSPIWDVRGKLEVSPNGRYLQHTDGTPFLWLGGTAWSMYIHADREDVIDYLDDRKAKGMTAIQAVAYPFAYPNKQDNHPSRYGHQPFEGGEYAPDLGAPLFKKGGSPDHPNDYWDHSGFMVRETRKRGMLFAILPCWGSGFVNNKGWGGWHDFQFTEEQARAYGKFLGERYKDEPHVVWVMGGDTTPGDKIHVYRAMAEGIVEGAGGVENTLMTYHPQPPYSSSEWFHNDAWLDFNMIETHKSQNRVVDVVTADYNKTPVKPTMNGEGNYESEGGAILGIHRDAFHTYLSGGMGYVYGLGLPVAVWDFQGNWRARLDYPGASDLPHIKQIMTSREWWKWIPDQGIFESGKGEANNKLEKVAVKSSDGDEIIVYFADNTPARIRLNRITSGSIVKGTWINPGDGKRTDAGDEYSRSDVVEFSPPKRWDDAVLVLEASVR